MKEAVENDDFEGEDDIRAGEDVISVPLTIAPQDDGLVGIKLAKEWCGNPIGASVRVDPLRAKWMRANGYEAADGVVPKSAAITGTIQPTIPATITVVRKAGV